MRTVSQPLISIIITTYNRSDFLNETLESIIIQSYKELEIFVIDDGSDKRHASRNQELCNSLVNCAYIYKKNTGQPDSRNTGIQRAKGDYICFCDDDDLWIRGKLQKQMAIFKSYPNISVVTGDIEYITLQGERTGNIKSHKGHNHGHVFYDFLLKNRTSSITPILKKEVFDKVGGFNSSFTIAEDWEFWRRVSYYYEFYNINEVLGYVRLHDNNMSLTRKNTPVERFLLYRKLTTALLSWGTNRFQAQDIEVINKTEWQFYRRILRNHFLGYVEKVKFLIKLSREDFNLACHIIYLALRFELKK